MRTFFSIPIAEGFFLISRGENSTSILSFLLIERKRKEKSTSLDSDTKSSRTEALQIVFKDFGAHFSN